MGCGGVRGCAGNGDGEGCVAGAPSGRADIGLPARWQNVGRRVERRRAEGIANPSACGSRTRRFFSGWFPASGSGPKFRVVAPALAVRDTAQDRQSGELWILASGQPSYPDAGLDSAGYQGRQQPGDLQLPKRCAVCGGFTRRQEVAYSVGAVEWNVLEISVPEGRVRTIVGGGGIFWEPDWAPSGTHFLFTNWGSSPHAIEDRSAADGFSRRVAEAPEGKYSAVNSARWAPDGTRFLFTQRAGLSQKQLMVADAAGGHRTALAELNDTSEGTYAWSPDSQWIVFQRAVGGKLQLAKMKPVAGAAAIPLAGAVPSAGNRSIVQWSGGGDWIAYQSPEGISMISPDGNTVRILTGRKLSGFAFSKDGNRSYGIFRNRTGEGAQWQLYSIDVKTGAEKMLAPIDLPASAGNILGFSLHPDGKRFLTSVSKWPFDIWMLEGWDQPQKTWLDRLLRR